MSLSKNGNSVKASFAREPLAIIGIGCRFPGGSDNPSTFWNLLARGADGIIEVPPDRWNIDRFYDPDPKAPGKMYIRAGGFLKGPIDQFDALFFGMSSREAERLDPQQRLLLEVAWEALEDAGLVPEALAGSNTGVYVGGFLLDNMITQMGALNREHIGPHSAVSSTMTMLSNRLSYTFDFRGPSLSIDTACSSSLVAFHQACQALWRNECSLALVGGVNVMHRPEMLITLCKGGFLSRDGRCKSFDARADGYGRGEGAGLIVIKPLAQALRDADAIYALVSATGVNQDGRTDGITVPNPAAQEMLIRQVCEQANLDPRSIRYVEAHGTGTAVGDPIEANALGSALGKGRAAHEACVVGSVKANIGHLEAASGIAGVIKAALCLNHRQIPPIANLEIANPSIPFEKLGLRLARTLESMSDGNEPAYVAINSFGYGGTNAHAILQEAPSPSTAVGVEEKQGMPFLLPFSARNKQALDALAKAYYMQLDAHTTTSAADIAGFRWLHDLCYSASVRRGHHDQRVALIADSRAAMQEQLASYIEGSQFGQSKGIATGSSPFKNEKPVFVFTGMGPQWWAMGRELLQQEGCFRRMAEECDAFFQRIAGWSIVAEMTADENCSRMGETQIAQPANFIVQVGLAALWREWGIEPAAIVGHSVGEVAAAYIAGILDLESAIRVVYHRSRVQKKAAGLGTMLAAGFSATEAQPFLAKYPGVSLAAINSSTAITFSGDAKALEEIAAALQENGIFNRFLQVEVAYHSPYMDPLKRELLDSLNDLKVNKARLPIYSTVTGELAAYDAYDAAYWCRNMRDPVHFAQAMDNLINDGHRVFLEIGPHPVLSSSIKQCLSHRDANGMAVSSLKREVPERRTMMETLAQLYASGCLIDWHAFYSQRGTYIRLPTYPWQRERYWQESDESIFDRLGHPGHALLGQRMIAPMPNWKSRLNRNLLPYIPDHLVEGLVVLPGAAYVELGLAVHHEISKGRITVSNVSPQVLVLKDLEFHKALVIEPGEEPILFITCDETRNDYAVYSQSRSGHSTEEAVTSWNLHARGTLSFALADEAKAISLAELQSRCTEMIDAETHYGNMHRRGLHYGSYFQGVRSLWRCPQGSEILALIKGDTRLANNQHQNHLHPTLLDACFQALLATINFDEDDNVYVPVSIQTIRLHRAPTHHFWCHGEVIERSEGMIKGHLTLFDEAGSILAEVHGVRAQALTRNHRDEIDDIDQWLYEFAWQKAALIPAPTRTGRWLVFMDEGGVAEQLTHALHAQGAEEIICVRPGRAFCREENAYIIDPQSKTDKERLLKEMTTEALEGIAYCWTLDTCEIDADPAPISQTQAMGAVELIQTLGESGVAYQPRLFIVTCRAQPVELQAFPNISLAQTPLIGLIRVAINEYAELRLRLVDIDDSSAALKLLAQEMLAQSEEEEVALREGERYVSRLVRRPVQDFEKEPRIARNGNANPTDPSHVETATKEIDVQVRLAFENEQNAIPPTTGASATITRVGEEVKGLKVGDVVLLSSLTETTTISRPSFNQNPGNSDSSIRGLPSLFRPNATYLITGGFGGLGLELAMWMASQGARHLVLVGRRTASTPEAVSVLEKLKRAQVNVRAMAVDVADAFQVERLLVEVDREMPVLKGVFHLAAVLDDGPVNAIDRTRLEHVMKPKASGAWNLHRHTLDLDYFVLFSSIAALVGSPRQAGYAMANTFLDALAHYRRARQLPAISINWGAISEVGMAARFEEVQQYFKRVGIGSFTPSQSMKLLEKILRWNPVNLSAAIMDWSRWGEANPPWAASARYRHLIVNQGQKTIATDDSTLLRRLADVAPKEREEIVINILTELVSQIVGFSADKFDRTHFLSGLGMNSLMFMDLQMAIEKRLGVKVPILELMKGINLVQLAQLLFTRLSVAETLAPPLVREDDLSTSIPLNVDNPEQIIDRLNDITDEEVDRLLEQLSLQENNK